MLMDRGALLQNLKPNRPAKAFWVDPPPHDHLAVRQPMLFGQRLAHTVRIPPNAADNDRFDLIAHGPNPSQ
jgi:hypothetical protein